MIRSPQKTWLAPFFAGCFSSQFKNLLRLVDFPIPSSFLHKATTIILTPTQFLVLFLNSLSVLGLGFSVLDLEFLVPTPSKFCNHPHYRTTSDDKANCNL